MSVQQFKSSPARLVRLFRKSRDAWKERAADKQRSLKKMRITVRDLSASRDHWRAVSSQLFTQLANLREQLAQTKQETGLGEV